MGVISGDVLSAVVLTTDSCGMRLSLPKNCVAVVVDEIRLDSGLKSGLSSGETSLCDARSGLVWMVALSEGPRRGGLSRMVSMDGPVESIGVLAGGLLYSMVLSCSRCIAG